MREGGRVKNIFTHQTADIEKDFLKIATSPGAICRLCGLRR
jgi:hypothetical protein